jgi:DNA mismatch endonuclease, patch repair protein
MADIFTKQKRSEIMSHIKGKNSKQELTVRKYLYSKGFRYRLHDTRLPGKPDIKLPKYKCVVLINGCFWHGHAECKASRIPSTNEKYWKEKITQNKNRDARIAEQLKILGYTVIIIWQCQLSNKEKSAATLQSLVKKIKKAGSRMDLKTADH